MKKKTKKLTLKGLEDRLLNVEAYSVITKESLGADFSVKIENLEDRFHRFELTCESFRAENVDRLAEKVAAMREEIQTLTALAAPGYLKRNNKVSLWSKIKGWFVNPKTDCSVNILEGDKATINYNNLTPVPWPDLAAVGETYRSPTEQPKWVGEGEGPKWSDPATWENCASKFKR